MGDHDRGPAGDEPAQALLDQALGVNVDVRGRLVEDEDARVRHQRAGERHQLALPGRQLHAALADLSVVTVLERGDERVRPDRARGGTDLLVGRRPPPERDVLADRAAEQEPLLRDDPHLRAQRIGGHRTQVVAVDEHRARGRVVEARHQLCERRLAGARLAHERDGLTGRDHQVEVAERPAARRRRRRTGTTPRRSAPRRGSTAARWRRARRRDPAPRRAGRRSCRARPSRTGTSCTAARAAGSGRRSC